MNPKGGLMAQSIIIVGGGIAGLSAGCYGRMNGFDTRILEMHDKPGGLCTSWQRGGYTFDGCIHWLVGSRPGSSFNQVWRELGAVQERAIVDHEEFIRVERGSRAFLFYTDPDRLEEHMSQKSPRDSRRAKKFCGAIRKFTGLRMPMDRPSGKEGLKILASMVRVALPLLRWSRVPMDRFADGFRDPLLRESFNVVFDLPDFPAIAALVTFAWMAEGDAGYPIGGSLEFARAIEKRYLELGGDIDYRARVEEVLVEGDTAVGVRLDDGTVHRGDRVISAADGHHTIFEMLKGRYADARVRGYYENLATFPAIIQVSLGIARDLSEEPHSLSFPLEKPVKIGGRTVRRLGMRHFCYDPTMAPEGKSALAVILESDHGYWSRLAADRKAYDAEKQRVADAVIEALDRRFPGVSTEVEALDVATPVTYERYTGNWKGSFEGWLPTTRNISMMVRGMRNTLPGLDNFYMVGQWVKPGGGLPPAALSGREVIQGICSESGIPFVTTEP
jgi:phytoene dehydrogenase-like protein